MVCAARLGAAGIILEQPAKPIPSYSYLILELPINENQY